MADNNFSSQVDAFINEDDLEIRTDRIATQFEVTPMTVKRWADGRAFPHPSLQKQVLTWIKAESK